MSELRPELRVVIILCLLIALVGLVFGLYAAWQLWPVEIASVDVADLGGESQDDYIILTASTFVYDRDLAKATERLALLRDPDIGQRLSTLARDLGEANRAEAGYVAALAIAQGNQDAEMVRLAASITPTATTTPTPVPTRPPTPTATPTLTPVPTRTAIPTRRRATLTPTKALNPVPGTVWMPARSDWPSVEYQPVDLTAVPAGQKYWRLVKAVFCDLRDKHDYCKDMPGGSDQQGIWISLVNAKGERESAPLIVTKNNGTPATVDDIGPEKSADDMCNCNYTYLANGWPIQVKGAPSDKISGLSMAQNYHVRYFLTFQLSIR